jgi:rubrerythrin
MHITLKRQVMPGGIKDLYKSMASSLGGSWNNTMFGGIPCLEELAVAQEWDTPIKFYCINCGYEHKESACPKCGSKAVRVR